MQGEKEGQGQGIPGVVTGQSDLPALDIFLSPGVYPCLGTKRSPPAIQREQADTGMWSNADVA